MTTLTFTRAVLQAATTAFSVAYTVPSGKLFILKSIHICNTTSADISAYLNIVPAAGAVGASNAIISAAPVPASGFLSDPQVLHILNAGDTLQIKSSAVGLTFAISGAVQG